MTLLHGLAIHANPDGTVQLGSAALPAHAARDVALRMLEAADAVPADQEHRRRTREHLDTLFASASPCRYWRVRTEEERKAGLPRSEARGWLLHRTATTALLRIGDTTTQLLVREGSFARGVGVSEWYHDELFGFVFRTTSLDWRLATRWSVRARLGGA